MNFFELEASDISTLNDGDLRELVARLCEAELIQRDIQPSCVIWGGAQEAADGGLDVSVINAGKISNPNFVPRENTGIQVKKHSMGKSACAKEMLEEGRPKAIIAELATRKGAYIIVSGKDDCTNKMLSARLSGMKEAVSSLQGKEHLLLDFYGRDRLSAWLRRHPGVALWVRSRLGKSLSGWKPFSRWAATPLEVDDEFLIDDHPCVTDANSAVKEPKPVLEGIQLTRDRLRKSGSTVRITGLSGVGKTRFAQVLFEPSVGHDALPASDVIYADLGNHITPSASELVTYLIANDLSTFVVLDNCPPDAHRSLQKQIAENGAKLHLLTIEYDISDDKPEETEVIHLEPSSESTVSKLVQRRYPELGPVNADRIAEFSGGNARIALALSSRVKADETLSNFSDEDLFQRLFAQRKGASTDLLHGAEALALVYSFNIAKSEFNDELGVLGNIASISRQSLYRNQAELLRRQLAQQRGNWRAVLPHALANRLAKRALENISPDDINSELFKTENFRLFQSCAHRLGYLHDVEQARVLALTWIRPGAPLHDLISCSEKYLVALDYVAPVFPEVVLSAIEQASADPSFASRNNDSFSRFVNLLCHLAYDKQLFDRVAEVLLKFAETEKQGENNNSIVGSMRQLFSLHLSGTEASPEQRQAFIKRLIQSGNQRHKEIACQLLSSAFQTNHWTSFGRFHFGARKRGHGWEPTTNVEAISWYVGHIRLLQSVLDAHLQQDREWAMSILAKHFRSLWSFAHCFEPLEDVICAHGQDGKWSEMWISIKQTINFDGDRHTPEMLARLESLEKRTAPSDTYSEIEAYAFTNVWEHIDLPNANFEEEERKLKDKVFRLGMLTASQPECLDRFGAKLWKTQAPLLLWFGKGLAAGNDERVSMLDLLFASFRRHRPEYPNLNVLQGYIQGVHEDDPIQARQMLERALDLLELKPYSVRLLTTVPIKPWTSRKLLELARGRELEACSFEQIRNGRWHESIPDSDLASLLTAINSLDRGYLSTIAILSQRFFEREHYVSTPSKELSAVARDAIRYLISAHRDEFSQIQLHGIDRILEEAFKTAEPEGGVNEIIELLCEGIATGRLYSFELTEVISALIKRYPELVLDTIFDGSEQEELLSHRLFRDRGNEVGPSLNDAPVDRVLAWCGSDQHRIETAAKAVLVYISSDPDGISGENSKRVVLSNHINSLMEVSCEKLAMVEIIFHAAWPSSYSGSLAAIIEGRSKAFAELLGHPSPEVQSLVRSKLNLLEQSVCDERENDARRNREREQRFE